MKIFRNFITAVVLLTSTAIFAQTEDKATPLLDDVAAKLESCNSLKIDFSLNIENNQTNKKESHKGSAVYKAGNYKMDLMGQIVFSDGKTVWTYLKDAEEVNITKNTDNESAMINPKTILKNYKQNFKTKYISEKFENNKALVEIDLYPKEIKDKKYSRITLKIEKTKKQIYSVKYIGKDGVDFFITLNTLLENPVLQDFEVKYSDKLFPNAEVIDMR